MYCEVGKEGKVQELGMGLGDAEAVLFLSDVEKDARERRVH